jgi:hypothetical protein
MVANRNKSDTPDLVRLRRARLDESLASSVQCQSTACISAVFTATKRIFGRPTASPIASASLRSFLFVFTYGFTNCLAISRTVWPNSESFRAHSQLVQGAGGRQVG